MLVRDDQYFETHINLHQVTCAYHQKNDGTYHVQTSDCETCDVDKETYDRIVAWMEGRE